MAQENGIVITKQGADPDPSPRVAPILAPDDIPIGGSKFNFSQYPSENDVPAPKKPVIRKPAKTAPKKEEPPAENVREY